MAGRVTTGAPASAWTTNWLFVAWLVALLAVLSGSAAAAPGALDRSFGAGFGYVRYADSTMIVDALLSHPDGVANIANRARGAGASEAEIQEAVEVAYLFGGTPALVTAVNAFRK